MSRGPQPFSRGAGSSNNGSSSPKSISSNYTVTETETLSVDTSAGAVTITPDTSSGLRCFIVFDKSSTFSVSNPCTISFGAPSGDAVLQTANDNFEFYLDDNDTWCFIDHGRSTSGVV